MNNSNTKRNLELISGIFGIVLGSIYTFFSIIALAMIEQMFGGVSGVGLVQAVMVMIMLVSIGIIIFGALLCPSPMKNGVLKGKMPLVITYIVLCSILAILFIISLAQVFNAFILIMLILLLVTVGLAAGSLAMQYNFPSAQQPYYQQNPYQQSVNPYQQNPYQQNSYQQQQNPYQQQPYNPNDQNNQKPQ